MNVLRNGSNRLLGGWLMFEIDQSIKLLFYTGCLSEDKYPV